jgi:hypothetical protein
MDNAYPQQEVQVHHNYAPLDMLMTVLSKHASNAQLIVSLVALFKIVPNACSFISYTRMLLIILLLVSKSAPMATLLTDKTANAYLAVVVVDFAPPRICVLLVSLAGT